MVVEEALHRSEIFIALISPHIEYAYYQLGEIKTAIELHKKKEISKIIPVYLPGEIPRIQLGLTHFKFYPLTNEQEFYALVNVLKDRQGARIFEANSYISMADCFLQEEQILQLTQPILLSLLGQLKATNQDAQFFAAVGVLDRSAKNIKIISFGEVNDAGRLIVFLAAAKSNLPPV